MVWYKAPTPTPSSLQSRGTDMCAVCFQWEKGKLTKTEALAALGELINTDAIEGEHFLEVSEMVIESEEDNEIQ